MPRVRTTIRQICVLAAFGAGIARSSDQSPILGVCDALSRLNELDGKIVRIRGEVRGGEGAWLVGQCKTHVGASNLPWPDIIWLATTQESRSPVPFVEDSYQLKHLDEQARRGHVRDADTMLVTYVGVLQAMPNVQSAARKRSDGTVVRSGFGHSGEAPAQLIVKTGFDLRILRGQKK